MYSSFPPGRCYHDTFFDIRYVDQHTIGTMFRNAYRYHIREVCYNVHIVIKIDVVNDDVYSSRHVLLQSLLLLVCCYCCWTMVVVV